MTDGSLHIYGAHHLTLNTSVFLPKKKKKHSNSSLRNILKCSVHCCWQLFCSGLGASEVTVPCCDLSFSHTPLSAPLLPCCSLCLWDGYFRPHLQVNLMALPPVPDRRQTVTSSSSLHSAANDRALVFLVLAIAFSKRVRLTGKTSEGLTTPWTSSHKNLCDTPLVVSVIHMCEVGCGHLTKMHLREVAGGSHSTLLQIEVPRSLRNLVCGQSLEIGALNRSLGLCWRLVFPGQGQARHSSHRVFLWVSHQARWSILAVTILL